METQVSPFRAIRVFVSSTFRDMQQEREELVKRVFPQLRRMCETRGVAWSEVDLRWGVTDEQKAEGAVLPICLAEIDRSRPYFIGLLGQRYGWVPEELPEGIVDRRPWLRSLHGTSVTEMEILHGVLNDPAAAGHAYFYVRDPAWVDSRSPEEQLVLGEVESDDEVAAVGAEAAAQAAAARRGRLEDLKHRVRDAGLPTWLYPDPVALGERVLADFSALIEQLYPAADVPDALQRDDDAHRAFGAAQTLGQVERTAVVASLDGFAAGDPPVGVLSGEQGGSTSAIISGWIQSWRERHGDDIVIEHHVGANADASEWGAMAARIIGELHRQHGWPPSSIEPPSDPAGRRAALFDALARAGTASRRTVIVVDNADLLTDVDGAPDLTWLPGTLGGAIRVVVATSGDRAVAEARRRGWPVTVVPPLDEAERRALISSFLARYSKGLDEVHVARLVSASGTGNTLFLRTVLDELRQHGDHFTLGRVIEHYVTAPTLDDLLARVLARYEGDFDRDRPGLVRDAMRALWAARRGLSEPELLDLLGTRATADDAGEPLPHAVWSPLLLAAEAGLVTNGGRLVFATEPHRRAVQRRYLASEDDQREAHAGLARLFAGYELGPRVVDELPWQQLGAGDLDGLFATLGDLRFTDAAYRRSYGDLRRLWRRLEESGRRVVDGYRAILANPAGDPDMAWEVARLVTDAGYPTEAAALNQFLVDTYRRGTDEVAARRLPGALVNLGAALMGQGELTRAEPVLQEAIDLSRGRSDLVVLRMALGDLALCRRDRGDLDGALPLFAEDEAICRRAGDSFGLQASLGNRSQLLRQRGDYAGALALVTEQEALCRAIGDATGVARALAGQAVLQADLGKPEEALVRFTAFRELCEELGDLKGVAEASISEVNTLRQIGRRDAAARRAVEAEALIRRLSDESLLSRILDAHARVAIDEGRWADGKRLSSEAVVMARTANATPALLLALGMLGTAQRELGESTAARLTHDEEEAIARRLDDRAALAGAEVNLAAVDIVDGNLQGALARYARAEPVFRELGVHMSLVPIYANRWQVHALLGNIPAAIDDLIAGGRSAAAIGALAQSREMLTRAVEQLYGAGRAAESEPVWDNIATVCEALGDESGLQRALGERATTVMARGDLAGAAALYDRQEEICRRSGDQVGLAACIGNRAILLRHRGDLTGSLRCIDEQMDIARRTGNGQAYLFATANRGEVLGAMGRVAEGLAALTDARTMAANSGLTPMVQQLDQRIAAMRAGQP